MIDEDNEIKQRVESLIDERQKLIHAQRASITRIDALTSELNEISKHIATQTFVTQAHDRGMSVFDVVMTFPPTEVPLKVAAVTRDAAVDIARGYFGIVYGGYTDADASQSDPREPIDVEDLDDDSQAIVNAVLEGTSSIANGMPMPEFTVTSC